MSPQPDTPAREVEHEQLTETRLAEMCAVMRRLEWRRGESGPEYAEKWGLSEDRVRHLAAEAWRRVKAEVMDHDSVSATVGVAIERVMREALAETKAPALIARGEHVFQESPNVARKVVLEAARVWSEISGAKAPSKSELTGKDGAPLTVSLDRLLEAEAVGVANETHDAGAVPRSPSEGEEPEG